MSGGAPAGFDMPQMPDMPNRPGGFDVPDLDFPDTFEERVAKILKKSATLGSGTPTG